jgi:hypothetical protein
VLGLSSWETSHRSCLCRTVPGYRGRVWGSYEPGANSGKGLQTLAMPCLDGWLTRILCATETNKDTSPGAWHRYRRLFLRGTGVPAGPGRPYCPLDRRWRMGGTGFVTGEEAPRRKCPKTKGITGGERDRTLEGLLPLTPLAGPVTPTQEAPSNLHYLTAMVFVLQSVLRHTRIGALWKTSSLFPFASPSPWLPA